MILAAGLGTRLMPLTRERPKALVEWNGVPMLEHIIRKLKSQGFNEVVINVHHFAEMIMDFVRKNNSFGIHIDFSHEEKEPLETGGGIAHARQFFESKPFLVHNVDIMCTVDLRELYLSHLESEAIATLAVKERPTSRSLLMNGEGHLKGWRDNRTGETILADPAGEELIPIAFSCMHVLDPEIFDYFPPEKKFSITPFYLELAKSRVVNMFRHDEDEWIDMGRIDAYKKNRK
jgi:NDP-sugar pyrophosphorylase family protein